MDDQGTLSTKQAVIMFIIAKSSKPFAAVVCHSSFVCQIIIRDMVERNHSKHQPCDNSNVASAIKTHPQVSTMLGQL
jgi:hypothetical protein